ncbi:hypothetical protein Q0O37_13820, partial [Staphylococcus aureus]|nr:hypothetical protein [Staphylococcus aureus]
LFFVRRRGLSVAEADDFEARLMAREEPRFNENFMASPPEEPRMRFRTPERDKIIVPWFAVEDVRPPERTFLMVTGESGYNRPFLCLA